MFRAWVLFVLSFALAEVAAAESRVALVIGNAAYKETAPLTNTRNDASDMAAALKRLGFEVLEGIDLDKRGMERLIRQFDQKLTGADLALFFYAGHGIQISGQNHLVPIDARLAAEGDVDFESLPLSLVLARMERSVKTSLVLLDACRDNPLARNLARTMGTRSAVIGQGLAEVKTGVGTLISFSTQPGNVALDGEGRNSPYATALLREIEKPGRDVMSLLADVRGEVIKVTGGKQVPWEHTSLLGSVYLQTAPGNSASSLPPAPLPQASSNDSAAREWQDVKDTSSISVLERYAQRHNADPVYSALAQDRIATLKQQQAALARREEEEARKRAEAEQRQRAEAAERERLAAQREQERKAAEEARKRNETAAAAQKAADAAEKERLAAVERMTLEKEKEKRDAEQRAAAAARGTQSSWQAQSAWVKLCEKAPTRVKGKDGRDETVQRDICLTHHEQLDGSTGTIRISAAVRQVEGQTAQHLMVMIPLGSALLPGMRFGVLDSEAWARFQKNGKADEAIPKIQLKYSLCHPAGCTAEAELTPALLTQLRSGTGLFAQAIDSNGKLLEYAAPLTGFAAALDGPPIDNAKYAKAKEALMDQIKKNSAKK